jgi:hypothetical protein
MCRVPPGNEQTDCQHYAAPVHGKIVDRLTTVQQSPRNE